MDNEGISRLGDELQQLLIDLNWILKDGAECCGVTLTQYNTLMIMGKHKEISIVELSSKLGLDTSTLSRTMNGLVNLGLASRVLNPSDRRYVSISLSEQGKNLLEKFNHTYESYLQKIFELIPEEKHSQVIETFLVFTEALKKIQGSCDCR